MPIVNPTEEQLATFAASAPDDAPIVMLNLLRFRDQADYGDGTTGVTGKKAYSRYSKGVLPLLFEVGGLPLWMGRGRYPFIAPEDESWDEVLLVHYPSRAAFVRMVNSPAYREVMKHRTAALADSRLIETTAAFLPKSLLKLGQVAIRVKTSLGFRHVG